MPRPCWSRTATATSRGRCWARLSPRCINQLVNSIRRGGCGPLVREHLSCVGGFSVPSWRLSGPRMRPPKKKKDQLSLAQSRGLAPCDRPDPDGPGGLGAEESGTERTGSTQNHLSQVGTAGGWRKWGRSEEHTSEL